MRDTWNRIGLAQHNAVRVHDNYIHHNQQYGKNGYGVSMHEGAYALIEKNVFDYNRHAIASAGDPGTGYYAHRQSGALARRDEQRDAATSTPTSSMCTARKAAGALELYCGDAGEKFDIRYNTILYDAGTAIKVRGKPSHRCDRRRQRLHARPRSGAGIWTTPRWCRTEGNNLYATNNTFGAADSRHDKSLSV